MGEVPPQGPPEASAPRFDEGSGGPSSLVVSGVAPGGPTGVSPYGPTGHEMATVVSTRSPTMTEWDVMPDDTGTALETFKSNVSRAVAEVCTRHGGPQQHLNFIHDTGDKRKAFAEWLYAAFPPSDSINYKFDAREFQAVPESELSSTPAIKVHLACFSFHPDASIKQAPGKDHTLRLADQILTEGFITSGDPLLLLLPDSENLHGCTPTWTCPGSSTPVEAQSIGYHKAQSRMLSLLSILSVCYEDKVRPDMIKEVLGV